MCSRMGSRMVGWEVGWVGWEVGWVGCEVGKAGGHSRMYDRIGWQNNPV